MNGRGKRKPSLRRWLHARAHVLRQFRASQRVAQGQKISQTQARARQRSVHGVHLQILTVDRAWKIYGILGDTPID